MAKRIFLWSVYAGVVGLLIFGAVIRTSAKAGGDYPQENRGKALSDLRENGQGSRGIDPEREEGESLHQAESENHEWIEISGLVSAIDANNLEVEIEDGSRLEITRRAWRFIQEQGFELSPADEVLLRGFLENGEFEIGGIQNLTSGAALSIRDEFGTPLWSGRGR
jgi:hypothetical protein